MTASDVQLAAVTLTADQVNNLHANPITVVRAPGPGSLVDALSILYVCRHGDDNFVGGGPVNLYWNSGTAIGTNGITAAQLKGGASLLIRDVPASAAVNLANALDKAVVLRNHSSLEYAGSSGTLTVLVAYRVISGL